MPAKSFLRTVGGLATQVFGVVTSNGAANAGDIPALNDSGVLDASVMPPGIAADTAVIVTSEAIAAGNFVNIYNNAGTVTCRKADASAGSGKQAWGYVLAAVASGANATVYFEGTNSQVTSQTGGTVWLSGTTPGGASATAPTTSGYIQQPLGVATSATSINVEIDQPIQLA